jgi:hypothetical protein
MNEQLQRDDAEAAREDLQNRTLAKISGDFARLIYLASMRDYNTGEYYHDGLALQFGEKAARKALASCHRDLFERMIRCSIRELVEHLEAYARNTGLPYSDFIRTWDRLQPYRVTIPLHCSALASQLFASNVRTALAVLDFGQSRRPPGLQSASPRR